MSIEHKEQQVTRTGNKGEPKITSCRCQRGWVKVTASQKVGWCQHWVADKDRWRGWTQDQLLLSSWERWGVLFDKHRWFQTPTGHIKQCWYNHICDTSACSWDTLGTSIPHSSNVQTTFTSRNIFIRHALGEPLARIPGVWHTFKSIVSMCSWASLSSPQSWKLYVGYFKQYTWMQIGIFYLSTPLAQHLFFMVIVRFIAICCYS